MNRSNNWLLLCGLGAPSIAGIAATILLSANMASGQTPQGAPAPSATCSSLMAFRMDAVNVQITSASDQAAGPMRSGRNGASVDLPAHCLVKGVIDKRVGAAGKQYGIEFEMRLPQAWNGRFLFSGGGGTNGSVRPALGAGTPPALAAGFAVISQDAGHEGNDSSFGQDQEARLDMNYRSYDRVTMVGKTLVNAFYRRPANRSYFDGCSEGGRQALLVSQRLPLEYDGVVAGDPGFQLGVNMDKIWTHKHFARISPLSPEGQPLISKAFSNSDLKLVADTILAQCDAKDGVKDGLIEEWGLCHPNLRTLSCKGKKSGQCLRDPQINALIAFYEGGTDSHGNVLSQGFPYDSGIDQPSFRQWRLTDGEPVGAGDRGTGGGITPMQGFMMSPFDPSYREDWKSDNYDKERLGMVQNGSLHRADLVTYSTFKDRGSKLLIYTGASDPIFTAKALSAWYMRMAAANGGPAEAQSFARLFVVPGMTHCGGGQSLDQFDPLTAVVNWVENGQAPDQLLATGKAFPGRTRPLCPYPQAALYRGSGSADDPSSFVCRDPNRSLH